MSFTDYKNKKLINTFKEVNKHLEYEYNTWSNIGLLINHNHFTFPNTS